MKMRWRILALLCAAMLCAGFALAGEEESGLPVPRVYWSRWKGTVVARLGGGEQGPVDICFFAEPSGALRWLASSDDSRKSVALDESALALLVPGESCGIVVSAKNGGAIYPTTKFTLPLSEDDPPAREISAKVPDSLSRTEMLNGPAADDWSGIMTFEYEFSQPGFYLTLAVTPPTRQNQYTCSHYCQSSEDTLYDASEALKESFRWIQDTAGEIELGTYRVDVYAGRALVASHSFEVKE